MGKNEMHFSSKSNEWYTPDKLYQELNNEFNFTLDPCCTIQSAKCLNFFTKKDNGLTKTWGGGHKVFMNPPYGREIKEWIKKAYEESLKPHTTVVCLIPARTDTSYWHDYIFNKAKDIRFLRGRIKFETIDGKSNNPAPFPSAIVIFT